PSKSEARRNIQGGGVSIDGEKVSDVNMLLSKEDFKDGEIVIKKGKKVFHKVVLK
ncbi:MAG: S4 domain-containing protein, partial [Clostridia bacterium]